MRGGRFMSVEDIIFLMRKDKVRLLVQTEIEQMTPFSLDASSDIHSSLKN